MKAMIFAAGLGTRLAPLTDTCPKALIEVGGKPMLRRVIDRLVSAGVSRIVVNVHHHADMVKDYLSSNDFGVEVLVSDESDMLLDTGGGVVKAISMLDGDEPVMLYNADIFSDFPIEDMLSAHLAGRADVTLLTQDRNTSRYLLFDDSGIMKGWCNKSTGEVRSPFDTDVVSSCSPLAFGGVHIVNPEVLQKLKSYNPKDKFSITPFYIDSCDTLSIRSYQPAEKYTWVDIGRPDSLAFAREIASLYKDCIMDSE